MWGLVKGVLGSSEFQSQGWCGSGRFSVRVEGECSGRGAIAGKCNVRVQSAQWYGVLHRLEYKQLPTCKPARKLLHLSTTRQGVGTTLLSDPK